MPPRMPPTMGVPVAARTSPVPPDVAVAPETPPAPPAAAAVVVWAEPWPVEPTLLPTWEAVWAEPWPVDSELLPTLAAVSAEPWTAAPAQLRRREVVTRAPCLQHL